MCACPGSLADQIMKSAWPIPSPEEVRAELREVIGWNEIREEIRQLVKEEMAKNQTGMPIFSGVTNTK